MVGVASRHAVIATHSTGRAFTISVRSHTVSTDQPMHAGGSDTAPTPLELISAGLAGCVALYTHKYCEENGLETEGLAAEVRPLWRDNRIARFDVILHVPAAIDPSEYAGLLDVAQTCPVHNTLTHAPEINVRIA